MRPGPELISIQIPAPAAGLNLEYLVSASLGEAQVMFMSFRLVTDATVSNRNVSVRITDPQGNLRARGQSAATQAASDTIVYALGATGTAYTSGSGSAIAIPFQNAFLRGGDVVRTAIDNIQAGDVLDNIILWIERFSPR